MSYNHHGLGSEDKDALAAYFEHYKNDENDSFDMNSSFGAGSAIDQPIQVDSPSKPGMAFATVDNYVTSCQYINQTLQLHSLPGPVNIETMNVVDKVTVVNLLYRLLQERQSQKKQKEEAMEHLHMLQDTVDRQDKRVQELKAELKAMEAAKWDVEMRRRKEEKFAARTITDLNNELAELTKKNIQIQNRDSQYRHERRKKEREYEKIQERLERLLKQGDKGNKAAASIEIKNHLAGAPGRVPRVKPADALHQQTIDAYEERLTEILEENSSLRTSLKTLSSKLQEALESHGGIYVTVANNVSVKVPVKPEVMEELEDFLPDSQLNMPYEFVREHIEKSVGTRLSILREKIKKLAELKDEQRDEKDSKIVRKLKDRCEEYRNMLTEQDRMLRAYLSTPAADSSEAQLLADSRRLSGRAELEREQRMYNEQQAKTAAERVQTPVSKPRAARAPVPATPAGIDLDSSMQSDYDAPSSTTRSSRKPPRPSTPSGSSRRSDSRDDAIESLRQTLSEAQSHQQAVGIKSPAAGARARSRPLRKSGSSSGLPQPAKREPVPTWNADSSESEES